MRFQLLHCVTRFYRNRDAERITGGDDESRTTIHTNTATGANLTADPPVVDFGRVELRTASVRSTCEFVHQRVCRSRRIDREPVPGEGFIADDECAGLSIDASEPCLISITFVPVIS